MPFKDSISKIAKSVEGSAKYVAKKSGDMVEITKLGREIASQEGKIKNLYYELGRLFYERYGGEKDFDKDISDICVQINEKYKIILGIKEKIASLKGMKICPRCGQELDIKIAYCPMCGTKQEMAEEVIGVQDRDVKVDENKELEKECEKDNASDESNEHGDG
ncbi:zinc ribbon domain-containing protein [Fonticella tunisiensis]|uniref:Zinc-ribbon domain-containing protein n=1 Tax=Fonticella tunisiensis TaxID=1096341 RepID=A0A4R7KC69_9CLOT|nr:zinc ribbon domain-containing protein [Fonticella tunisiensis]TDT51879.1 hypothetical protein EDD71_11714 [Fonticella tunisiensis]